MNELRNHITSLLGRLYYLPTMFTDPALRAEVESFIPDYIAQLEDTLGRAYETVGLGREVAHDAAFLYIHGVLDGLRRTTAEPADA